MRFRDCDLRTLLALVGRCLTMAAFAGWIEFNWGAGYGGFYQSKVAVDQQLLWRKGLVLLVGTYW